MIVYDVNLVRREEVAKGTMAFHFSKPADFRFTPGQAVDVVLIDTPATDAQSSRHAFSLVSAPFEDGLVIATRMRDSAYKQALKSLPVGSAARIEGPFGSFALHNDRARPAVFIAGGIGVTPFMSILRQAAKDRLRQRLLLLYTNRRPEDSAFLPELQELERRNREFRLVATMTEMGKSDRAWEGETGMIDDNFVKRINRDLPAPVYYIAGPPAMVESMRSMLIGIGIDTQEVRSDEFYGY